MPKASSALNQALLAIDDYWDGGDATRLHCIRAAQRAFGC
jgi:hypothetical protein